MHAIHHVSEINAGGKDMFDPVGRQMDKGARVPLLAAADTLD